MTAASAKNVVTRTRDHVQGIKSWPMKLSQQIWDGTLVAVDITTGLVEPATNAANKRVVGVAHGSKLAAASGTTLIEVESGKDFLFTSSGLAAADAQNMAFVTDDSTVQTAVGTAGVKAGRIVEVVSATQAWIYVPPQGLEVAAVSANASDLATAQTLVNELKGVVNQMVG